MPARRGEKNGRSVLVIGSTGLVGRECVKLLISDETCCRVVALARKPTADLPDSPKLDLRVVKFDDLESQSSLFAVDQIICALGTTARRTPSRDSYRMIDYQYPLTAARLGKANGATHYLVVSAVGANPQSRIFYNRLKGELEQSLASVEYRSLTIVRPSVLIGHRAEHRRSEEIAWKLSFLTPRKYKPVPSLNVARALVASGREDAPGIRIIENKELLPIS
jgi:uncharacterized protein YbjT (DUF2867 family)